MAKFKKGSAAAKAYMAKLRAAKGKKKPTIKKPAVKKSTTKKVGEVYYYGEGKKISTGRLVIGEKYEWILGAGYQEVIYVGLTSKNPNYRAGSRLGNGGYLFKWVEDGSYVDLSAVAVLQSIRTIPNKSVGKTKSTSTKRKSTSTKSKTPVSKHKDTKSHNVNIRVVSGFDNSKVITEINNLLKYNEKLEKQILLIDAMIKRNGLTPIEKRVLRKNKKSYSDLLKDNRKHLRTLKKHIK